MSSILVLDDTKTDRELLATVLGYDGHRVTLVSTAEDALEQARTHPFDLIITDLMMPGTNGYEFVRSLRAEPDIADTTVVFCTANYMEEDVRHVAAACGVTRFLPKPSDPKTIMRTVREALSLEGRPAAFREKEFNREQLRVLNDKLSQKVTELEVVNGERKKLVTQLIHAREDERRRIAQDVHDGPVQALAAATIWLDLVRPSVDDAESVKRLETLRASVSRAVEDLRRLVFALHPLGVGSQGLAVATEICLENAREEFGFSGSLENRMTHEPAEAIRNLLYRAAQEVLVNIGKHATASRVDVVLDQENRKFVLRVQDDGKGCDVKEAMRVRPGHLGLPSLREQVESAGGSLRMESWPGEGATVEIRVPDLGTEAVENAGDRVATAGSLGAVA